MDTGFEQESTQGGIAYAGYADEEACSFAEAVSGIETAVVGSCDAHEEWPARVVAGITAAVDFVSSEPVAARALAIDARSEEPDGAAYHQAIDRFAHLLGAGAPRPERLPASTDRSVVSVIASVISCHIRTGTTRVLSAGDPNLIFLALLPYMGFDEATRWSSAT